LTIGLFLPASIAGADDPIPTPTPVAEQPAHIEVLPSLPMAPSPEFKSQGPYIYLTSYTFDPLSEPTPHSLPTDLTLSGYPPGEEGYYLLQFYGPIQPTWKEAIVAAGAQVFDYIPDFAFIVKMDDSTKAAVEAMEAVRWVGLYQPGYRIALSLMDAAGSAGDAESVDVMVIVFRGEDVTALTGQLHGLGGTILDVTETHWKGKIRVQIPRSQINAVAHLTGVRWIEPSPEWELFNNKAADILDVRDVWDTHGLYGAGQTVAVCDTGLDQGSASPGSLHDDFEDGSGSSRVVAIYDRVGDGANDVNSGHGTHVAGSVLGNGDRSGSTPSSHTYPSGAYVGMAPEASLVFQAVEQNSTGSLAGIPSDLNALFNQVLGDGARIHTSSWGSAAAGAYTSSSEEVDEFVWDHKDFAILFSAGNEGVDSDADGVIDTYSVGSPGTAKNCITVGASENNRSNRSSGGYNPGGACSTWGNCWPTQYSANPIRDDRLSDDPTGLAAFSSRGPTLDGRFKPDLVAPGTNVASVRSSVASGSGWGTINSYYVYMGGTSMSTPLVAGTAALVREYYADTEGITPSGALIKATLVNGATDISPGQYGTGSDQEIPNPPRPNNVEGWGRVNVENAIFPTAPRELIYDDQAAGPSTGEELAYNIQVTDSSEPLNVTLAWSDYPGSPAATGGLVNDLDLSVTAPGGTVYYPNHASQRGASEYLYYDDGVPNGGYTWSSGKRVAVRFTPNSYPATLDKAQFLLASTSSYPKTFNYYIYDGDTSGPDTVLASASTAIRQAGWHVVDLSGHGVTINSGDFFLAIRLPDSQLAWPYDSTSPIDDRGWVYDGSSWSQWTTNDFMFRAVVTGPDYSTSFDRVNNVVGIDIDNPATGVHTVTVRGYNVPYGPQPYALVASGAIQRVGNTAPVITGLPDQTLLVNTSLDNAIDLWAYASDFESPDSDLTYSIDNTPDPNAGVTLDSDRYIDINPTTDWTGQTDVTIRVEDPGGLSDTASPSVTASSQGAWALAGQPTPRMKGGCRSVRVIPVQAPTASCSTIA
jgi:subtilisin family serine protease